MTNGTCTALWHCCCSPAWLCQWDYGLNGALFVMNSEPVSGWLAKLLKRNDQSISCVWIRDSCLVQVLTALSWRYLRDGQKDGKLNFFFPCYLHPHRHALWVTYGPDKDFKFSLNSSLEEKIPKEIGICFVSVLPVWTTRLLSNISRSSLPS